ncbi:hypothetical protein [Saccharopolyspora cebuensis]|uniref:hypothetical protein n=1 Tax=Saccharopolyspora cebuensis TaxID=418759 RepID=UPI0031E71DAE
MSRGQGDGFVLRNLDTVELQRQAAALYRRVFGYGDPDFGLSPRLLTGLLRNGGSVVGAVDRDGALLAFAYGMCAADSTGGYHYSQAAVVAPGNQGRGLGRLLKQAQAEVARSTGTRRMRWSYDPLVARNAHFNLDVLGAVGRWYVADFYFDGDSDRVVVEWDLDGRAEPVAARSPERGPDRWAWGRTWREGDDGWLAVPADLDGLGEADRIELRDRVRDGFRGFLGDGLVARSCTRADPGTAVYRFTGRGAA